MVQVTEQAQYKVNNDRAAAQVVKKINLSSQRKRHLPRIVNLVKTI